MTFYFVYISFSVILYRCTAILSGEYYIYIIYKYILHNIIYIIIYLLYKLLTKTTVRSIFMVGSGVA